MCGNTVCNALEANCCEQTLRRTGSELEPVWLNEAVGAGRNLTWVARREWFMDDRRKESEVGSEVLLYDLGRAVQAWDSFAFTLPFTLLSPGKHH